ncbi:hypothetical protein F895_00655 [Acinetobacter sp. CIP 64.2]|nr:hypothetical protein F895_00655 [Acinetobacter sp. CIP 64.2]
MPRIALALSLILYFLMTSYIFASSTGEIYFHGAIIEESQCQVLQINHKILLDCSRTDHTVSESKVLSDSQLKYLDEENNLAVMLLTYH